MPTASSSRRHSAASVHSPHRRSSRHDSSGSESASPRTGGFFFRYTRHLVPNEDRWSSRDDSYFPSVPLETASRAGSQSLSLEDIEEGMPSIQMPPARTGTQLSSMARTPLGSPKRPRPSSRNGTYTREQIREEKRKVFLAEDIGEGFNDEAWLAAVMCSDQKLAIFKRYDELATEVLLGYERRLEALECRLAKMDREMEVESDERTKLLEEIEADLMGYFDLLSLHTTSLKYKVPNRKDLKALNHYRHLTYPNSPPYTQESVLALIPRPDDMFELLTEQSSPVMVIGRFFQRIKRAILPRSRKAKLKKPRDWTSASSMSARVARFAITLLAPLMTLVPIVVLYFLPTASLRLMTVVLFTLGFTIILGISDASNADVLAGSTGYAAVLVVFVGTGAFAG